MVSVVALQWGSALGLVGGPFCVDLPVLPQSRNMHNRLIGDCVYPAGFLILEAVVFFLQISDLK